jgi:hypothetical protein
MEPITSQARANSFTKEEKVRRTAADTNKDYFYDRQAQYIHLLSVEQEAMTVNLTKPITKKRSTMLYQGHLVRTMTGPAASITALEKIYADIDIDSVMLKTDQATELTGTALLFPKVDMTPEGITVKLMIYDGSMISALPSEDDPEIPAAISIIRMIPILKDSRITDMQIKQQIWTDTAVVDYLGDQLVSSQTNSLGFIPFVAFKGEEVTNQYLGEAPITGVRHLNSSINQMLTNLGYTVKMQTASPVALEGYQTGEQIVLHPGRAFSLPMGAKASILDFNPKIKEALDVIGYIEEKVYETSSVPKVCIVGGEGTSGRELLVRWFPLTQVFQEKSVRFQKYEFTLANCILRVLGLAPIKELIVDYPDDANLPLSTSEDTLKQDIELGISTAAIEMVRRNPEMTIAEAEAFVKHNITFTDSLTSAEPVDTAPQVK